MVSIKLDCDPSTSRTICHSLSPGLSLHRSDGPVYTLSGKGTVLSHYIHIAPASAMVT